MAQNELPPAGWRWLTPHLTVNDLAQTLDLYERAFGFARGEVLEDNGTMIYAEVTYHGQVICMIRPEGGEGSTAQTPISTGVESPVAFYVYCEDADKRYMQATTVGAKAVSEPVDMFWGDRVCRLADADGYVWSFATPIQE